MPMDLHALKDVILMQQSTAARLDIIEAQINELSQEVRSIKESRRPLNMSTEATQQLLSAFQKTQNLSLELIAEFRKLRGAATRAMIITISAVMLVSGISSYYILSVTSSEASKQLASILNNQESMEDVMISDGAAHKKTQAMLEQLQGRCGGSSDGAVHSLPSNNGHEKER